MHIIRRYVYYYIKNNSPKNLLINHKETIYFNNHYTCIKFAKKKYIYLNYQP